MNRIVETWVLVLLVGLGSLLLVPRNSAAVKSKGEPNRAGDAGTGSLEGSWTAGDLAMFTVKQSGNRFLFFGQGLQEGKYFLRKGWGTIKGDRIRATWAELPESEFYPGTGEAVATLEKDGRIVRWQDSGLFRVWTRARDTATGERPASGLETGGTPGGAAGGTTEISTWSDAEQAFETGDGTSGSTPTTAGGGGWEDGFHTDGADAGDTLALGGNDWDSAAGSLTGGQGVSGSDGGTILESSDPWNNPRIQEIMDAWLSRARPPASEKDPSWRYNEYGQMVGGKAFVYSRPPNDVLSLGRYRYLWNMANRLPSTNLGTLMQYIRHILLGEIIPPYEGSALAEGPPGDDRGGEDSGLETSIAGIPDPEQRKMLVGTWLYEGVISTYRSGTTTSKKAKGKPGAREETHLDLRFRVVSSKTCKTKTALNRFGVEISLMHPKVNRPYKTLFNLGGRALLTKNNGKSPCLEWKGDRAFLLYRYEVGSGTPGNRARRKPYVYSHEISLRPLSYGKLEVFYRFRVNGSLRHEYRVTAIRSTKKK